MAFKHSQHTSIPRVFISSTAEDLEPYRQKAYDAANGAGFSADRHENWPATGRLPLDESLKRVSEADVLIVIVAHRYGWVPPEQRKGEYKSITWLECEKAISEGKEVLAFLLDHESDWPPEHKEENRLSIAFRNGSATKELFDEVQLSMDGLNRFRAWLNAKTVYAKFTSPEDLRGRVVEALHQWRSRHAEFAFVEDPRRAQQVDEASYRAWLQELTETIDIRGIASRGQLDAYRFPLLRLYTELHVRSVRGEGASVVGAEKRQRLTQIVGQVPRTVILGQPGSGKTTFLRRLAKKLVGNNEYLPLFQRINDLYEHLTDAKQARSPGWRLFISYWLQQSEVNNWGFTESWLFAQMSEGQVWVLLDSLDELPNQDARAQIVRTIESAAEKWPRCRWVLTSRPGVLMGSATPDRFLHCEIDDLDDSEIHDFVNAWVRCLFYNPRGESDGKSSGDDYAADLYNAIRDNADIRPLARNPLMLTCIAVIHWNQKRLPEGRAELYEAVIEWLIRARRALPNRKDVWTTEQCYQLLALEMFQHPEGRQTRVGYLWAAQKIMSHFEGDTVQKKVDSALHFLEQEEIDTGILLREGEGNIEFRHLSFQEYLAACKIASLTDDEEDGWWPLIKDKLYNPEWSNLLRFFPVRLLKLGDPRVKLFVKRVLKTGPSGSLAETARVVGFLARTLFDLRMYTHSLMTVDEYTKAREKVMQIFNPESLPLSLHERFDAAIALGITGDPRLFNPDENWVRIPGGVQFVGAQRHDPSQLNFDEFAGDKEQPVHQVYTGSFEIGKYPVTVQEYAAFVKDGGYQNPSLWDAEGWTWRSDIDVTAPDQWDKQQQYPNCPVVYICWYEAQAYCKWLTQVDEEMNYRLPSEAEWEYGARRGHKKYLRYCFGNISPDEVTDEINWEHCGSPDEFESRIAPVGLFLVDASRDGVMDVNGNVSEWMLDAGNSKYQSSPLQASLINEQPTYLRALRGGSFQDLSHNCRTSFRTSVLVENRYQNVGFRVIRTRRPIAIKSQLPRRHYRTTLADVFAKHGNAVYSHEKASQLLSFYAERCPGLNADIIATLFPADAVREKRPFDRLPCVLANAPPTKLDFNLLYQDARIKLAVEEKLPDEMAPEEFERDAAELMEVISILLRATGIHNNVLWQDLTDNDLDAITYMSLERYDSDRAERLVAAGHRVNQIALATLPIAINLSLEGLIEHQIFAGTIWWTEGAASLKEQFSTISSLEISDVDLLKKEALTGRRHLIFFFDDNGELVWDLALIMRMLKENPTLSVTGVVSTQAVANNSNLETLRACLEHSFLADLKESERFKIFAEYNTRSAFDPKFCSSELINMMRSADVALVKGVAMFETMQKLPVPTYYGFVVHSRDSQICTGMRKGSGVFVRVPPGRFGYDYHQQTLRELYPRLRAQA